MTAVGTSKDNSLQSDDPALQRPHAKRSKYPEPKEDPPQVNFLGMITKLLTSGELASFIARGVYPSPLHEGLSELHRKAETAIAYPLLDKAAKEPKGSEMRLMYVTGYNIACWFEQRIRLTYKPLKPMERETCEYVDPDGNFKLLVEEVLQNRELKTVVTCWKGWGKEWTLDYHMQPTVKFTILTGPALEYNAHCIGEITFADGDKYTTTLAPGVVSSLASTPQVFTYKGTAYVTNVGTGLKSETDLTEPGFLSTGKKHQVKGILTKDGKKASDLQLGGKWDEKFFVTDKSSGKETIIWERDTFPRDATRCGLNEFAISLNYLTKELAEVLPPTDSRLRPDVRAVEEGRYSVADEEIQRISSLNEANFSKGNDLSCKGRWFHPASEGSYLQYRYKGGYWEARAAKATGDAKAFADLPDIFGLAQSIST